MSKILTQEQVREYQTRAVWAEVIKMADSHEALRAEVKRLQRKEKDDAGGTSDD